MTAFGRCGSEQHRRKAATRAARHGPFQPSFSMISVSMPTMRLPRLMRDSLAGTLAALAGGTRKTLGVLCGLLAGHPEVRSVCHERSHFRHLDFSGQLGDVIPVEQSLEVTYALWDVVPVDLRSPWREPCWPVPP